MVPRAKHVDAALTELRAFGLRLPETHTKTPWPGHLDLAVKGKTFAFMSTGGEPFSITCKLPESGVAALMFPFATPAAYGLGKSGWVNARFAQGIVPPAEILQVFKEWIEESYRATAPKKLVAAIGGGTPAVAKSPSKARKKPAAGSGTVQKRKATSSPRKAASSPRKAKRASKKKASKARRK